MSFNFVVDSIVANKAYPALAKWQAQPYTQEWRQFVQHWPCTIPYDLHEYCYTHGYEFKLYTINEDYPNDSYYPIALGFFNFDIDYFLLLPALIENAVRNNNLKVLFYYHEGDNPYNIKVRLDELCLANNLPTDCYKFISGNTEAKNIPGFVYFPDHELLYWQRNKNIEPLPIHILKRDKDFTVLSRTHKWWRATVMTDLWRNGLLENSYWSYNTQIALDEPFTDNPIEVDTLNIRNDMVTFLSQGPYTCDTLTEREHNNHSIIEASHFTNSYCNIIIETHFDADGSGGAFLTEKTFKAIKHGQPFIIIGAPGSLAALRKLGYKTFDNAIDNSYDTECNNTARWLKIVDIIKNLKSKDLHSWFNECYDDIIHNQRLFENSKYCRLNKLRVDLYSV